MATKERIVGTDTKYGNWLRHNEALSSDNGYVTSNLDYIWYDYHSCLFMLLEEKCQMATSSYSQRQIFKQLHNSIDNTNYRGFHLIQFENTSPKDGKIYLDSNEVSEKKLERFLSFDLPIGWYDTYEDYF